MCVIFSKNNQLFTKIYLIVAVLIVIQPTEQCTIASE